MKLESVIIKVAVIILAVKALFILSTFIFIYVNIHNATASGKYKPKNEPKEDHISASFVLNDGGGSYALSRVDMEAKEYVIPAEYNGLPVTAINRGAFYYVEYPTGCAGPNVYTARLDTLTIPSSITEIRYGAFYNAEIKNIYFEGTIENWCSITFGSSVFGDETSLYIGGEEVTDLSLPETVDKVESEAFRGYQRLTSVNLNLVETVGSEAFACCHNLESVTADNLKFIESAAFEDCALLESFDINSSPLEKIDENAFRRCEKLYSFTLPESFISVGEKAFLGCVGLYDVYNYSKLNVALGKSDNGNIAENALIVHTKPDDGLTLKIDENFGWILNEERCQLIKYFGTNPELILPDDIDGKLYDIRENTFYGNRVVTDVTLPDFMTSVDAYSFYSCTNLKTVRGACVSEVGEHAFRHCSNLEEVLTLPLGKLGKSAFLSCYKLKAVSFSDSLAEIPEDCFSQCNALESVVLPAADGLVLKEGCFKFCDGLKSVTFKDNTFSIEKYAFYSCDLLEEITIPANCTSIGYHAFAYCGLKKLTIGADVSDSAFEYCNELSEVKLSEGVKRVEISAFNGSKVESLAFPASCESVLVQDIDVYGGYSFPRLILKDFTVAEGNTVLKKTGGCLIDIEQKKLIMGLDNAQIPDDGSVETIGLYAFCNRELGGVVLPESVKKLEAGAFYDSEITGVVLSKVENIGIEAFWSCEKLQSVEFYDGLKRIGSSAFESCESLKAANLPENCSFGSWTFAYCSSLESVVLPVQMKQIPDYAFRNCSALKEIIIPDGVIIIDFSSFAGCTSLERVVLPSTIKSLCSDAFKEAAVEEIEYGGTVEDWQTVYKGSSRPFIKGPVKIKCSDGTVEETFK